MNRQRIVALALVAALAAGGCGLARKPRLVPQPEPKIIALPEGAAAFADELLLVGEELEYQIRWLGMDVGKAVLGVKRRALFEDRQVYHVRMTVKTHGFFSLFFHVDGVIDSYVDIETSRSVYYNSETTINRKFVYKRMWYDLTAGRVRAQDRKGTYELELTADMLDPLGIFYYFRKHPPAVDEPIEVVINGGKRNFPVTIYVRQERKIHVPAGTFAAFLVEPTNPSERQFDDVLNTAGSLRIWFSADERRIPIMITLQVPLGTAIAALSRASYPAGEQPADVCPAAAAHAAGGEHL